MLNVLKIFIADDHISYRSQIEKRLSTLPKVEVVGSSRLGSSTFSILESCKPDVLVIELNPESPKGSQLLEEIKAKGLKIPSIIAILHNHAQKSRALHLGATQVFAKNLGDLGDEAQVATLIKDYFASKQNASESKATKRSKPLIMDGWHPRAVVIASSTGGPPVLEEIFRQLRPPLFVPMFIAQHMPEFFTRDLALRLAQVSQLTVREAVNGEEALPGVVYISPGNYHMRLNIYAKKVVILLDQEEKLHSVRPAADYLFRTAANIYGKDCLGIVLTGMGNDGADGALQVKNAGGRVAIQDKESSAVWGMPGAAHALGAFDTIEGVEGIAQIMRLSMARNAS